MINGYINRDTLIGKLRYACVVNHLDKDTMEAAVKIIEDTHGYWIDPGDPPDEEGRYLVALERNGRVYADSALYLQLREDEDSRWIGMPPDINVLGWLPMPEVDFFKEEKNGNV